ncbi:TPA: hypothetical protein NO688_001642 [Klebsiella pneumoniae]|nr:hypothetical protein [Klebsiella pneumoniae]
MSLEDRIAILENIITSLQAQLNYIMTDSMKQKEGGEASPDIVSPP